MNQSSTHPLQLAPAQARSAGKALYQQGQALVEGMVALIVLISLWVGIAWLARYQDMALQASHASRYAAFTFTRNLQAPVESDVRQYYFSGPAHQWSDRGGKQLLTDGRAEVGLRYDSSSVLAARAQPGGNALYARTLRQEWHLDDKGISSGHITVAPLSGRAMRPEIPSFTGLNYFDNQRLVLRRHTAILAGAGHAADDTAAQQVVADSALAWGHSAHASYALGARIAAAMARVDTAWNRTEPVFDWLVPWAGHVPDSHLGN